MNTKVDYAPQTKEEPLGVSRDSLNYYERKVRRWRNRVGLVLVVIAFAFFAYILVWSGNFSVRTITITGLQRLNEAQLQQRISTFLQKPLLGLFPQDNIFAMRLERLTAFLLYDPHIGNVDVSRSYKDRTLNIHIDERVPFFVLNLPTSSYVLDQEGRVLTQLTPPVPKTLPHITDTREQAIALGDQAFSPVVFSFLKTFREELPVIVPFTTLTIGEPSLDAMTFQTEEGWRVYVNMNDDAEAQLQRLRALLASKISAKQRARLSYIDLRFGEKVYFK